jgi:1,4-dihydroxy-2-naphthoate octaprenyltransferase
MLSDVFDYRRGLDREVTPVSGAIVRGWLSDGQVLRASLLLFAIGIFMGAMLAWRLAPALWGVGAVGVAVGASYSLLKLRALGDVAVFLNFGVLGAVGAWTVQTGRFSLYPAIVAVPMALLVAAILHANNWRDIARDSAYDVTTMASRFGDEGSLHYYGFLLFAPFGFLIALIWAPRALALRTSPLPLSAALGLLALPRAARLWGRAICRHRPKHPLDFITLDAATAQLNLLFGALLTMGVAVAAFAEALR